MQAGTRGGKWGVATADCCRFDRARRWDLSEYGFDAVKVWEKERNTQDNRVACYELSLSQPTGTSDAPGA
jgi:hypothetical protein